MPESKNRQKNRFRQSQFVPNQTPTTTIFRGVETYGSLFDFQYARWNGVHYQTDYSAVSYEDLDDLAGFSVAIQSESDRVYTILVYPLKGYSIQDCIAVQYAGDSDYFYFYAIS